MAQSIAGLAAHDPDVPAPEKPAGGAQSSPFRGRKGDGLSFLYWDGQGFALTYKSQDAAAFLGLR